MDHALDPYTFTTTPPFTFKKCTFIAYTCPVVSLAEATAAYNALRSEGQLKDEMHVAPYAFRVAEENGGEGEDPETQTGTLIPGIAAPASVYQDFSNDMGDFGASAKLLFLLKRFNKPNLLLVVATVMTKAIMPHASLGVRRYKFVVSAAKLAVDDGVAGYFDSDNGLDNGTYGGQHSVGESSLDSLENRQVETFNVNVRASPRNDADDGSIGSFSYTVNSNNNGERVVGRSSMKAKEMLVSDLPLPKVKKVDKQGQTNNFMNITPREGVKKGGGNMSKGKTLGKTLNSSSRSELMDDFSVQGSLQSQSVNSVNWLRDKVSRERQQVGTEASSLPRPPSSQMEEAFPDRVSVRGRSNTDYDEVGPFDVTGPSDAPSAPVRAVPLLQLTKAQQREVKGLRAAVPEILKIFQSVLILFKGGAKEFAEADLFVCREFVASCAYGSLDMSLVMGSRASKVKKKLATLQNDIQQIDRKSMVASAVLQWVMKCVQVDNAWLSGCLEDEGEVALGLA